ncbi:uncharacterized protein LOC124271014 [Haliotis rubra]|uniref:uncharacterized protein LOC124271014 n=1 Tax=Haliotis rubra TaxID=36100 RepID=UPI001EE5E89E|nr:uncharacterized protein LOC124271014 [Haliotis rubra]
MDQPLDTNLSIDSIISLTKSCITSTYFTLGDNIFEQIHGHPMGSPLSPIITEIYMTHFEEQALASSPIQPVCWYRKVDGTFVILRKDQDPTSLLQHLNTQHPRIKFSMETKRDSTLPFLDAHVSNDPCKKIQTKVYRNPTHSDYHDLEHELNHLQHVFTSLNQYPTNLVKRTISTTLHDKPKLTKPESVPIKITLPYIGKTSHQISRLLKHQAGIDIIFTGSATLRTILQANDRNLPSKKQPPKGVIYKISCECGDFCIVTPLLLGGVTQVIAGTTRAVEVSSRMD